MKSFESRHSGKLMIKDIISNSKLIFFHLWKRKLLIFFFAFLGTLFGYLYVKNYTKGIYTASINFTMEQKNGSSGALGGLASTLGIGDVGGVSSSGMFGGENILHLIKSNRIIHQSLKEPQASLKGENLLNLYLKNHFKKLLQSKKIKLFPHNIDLVFTRKQDSLLLLITRDIRDSQLFVDRLDKKTTIINLDVKDIDENWAYLFSRALVKNAINLYLDIKIGKLLRAEKDFEIKRDSIRNLLNGSITTLAWETDINSHTPMMIHKTNQVKKQIDVDVLKGMYANVIQNLEVTRLQRSQEEPIIEIIDEPMLPLPIERLSIAKGMVIGAIISIFLIVVLLLGIKLVIDLEKSN